MALAAERRLLREEIDYLRGFLEPGFEVKFRTASCYESPQQRLYSRDIARRQRSEDRAARAETLRSPPLGSNTSLKRLRLLGNDGIGQQGKLLLRDAVAGRHGFGLQLHGV